MSKRRHWTVLTPVFEDRDSFAQLCRDIAEAGQGLDLHVCAVDDGSVTAPPDPSAISDVGLQGEVIRLRRNVGHQMAIAIGLNHLAMDDDLDGVVIMDSDGEDRPNRIPELIASLSGDSVDGGADIVVASRSRRSETLTFRAFYVIYKMFFKILTGSVIRFGNFMAISQVALRRLAAMQEAWTHVAGAVVKSRLRRVELPIDRGQRYSGQSRMGFVSLVLHGIRSVMVFGDAVLTRMAVVFGLSAVCTVVVFAIAAFLKISGQATPGWLTTVTGFMLVIFMQTGVLTLMTLIMSGLATVRSPRTIAEDAQSFIQSIDVVDAKAEAAA